MKERKKRQIEIVLIFARFCYFLVIQISIRVDKISRISSFQIFRVNIISRISSSQKFRVNKISRISSFQIFRVDKISRISSFQIFQVEKNSQKWTKYAKITN